MKAKTKLIASIMSICLVCAVFAIGVFALKTANLKIGGDVSFTATGVEATISGANITGKDDTTANAEFIMDTDEKISIDTTMTQSDIDTAFASWKGLDLVFDEDGEDIEISFDIINDSDNPNNYIEIDYDYSFGEKASNVGLFPGANNDYLLDPNATESTKFSILIKILDKELDISNTTLDLTISLKHQGAVTLIDNAYDNVVYGINETLSTAYVSGYNNSPTDITIPAVVSDGSKNYEVTSITGDWNASCPIETISLPNTITSFGYYAFNQSKLTKIVMPKSLKSIGMWAFGDCKKLSEVILNEGLTEIMESAFGGSVTSLEIPSSVTSIDPYFANSLMMTSLKISPLNSVYDSRNDCNAIIEIATDTLIWTCQGTSETVMEMVTHIGDSAFLGKGWLTEIKIPANIQSIGGASFDGLGNLEKVHIDSQPVVSKITSNFSVGCLLYYPTLIYIKDGLDVSEATYLTNISNFTPEKIGDVVGDSDADGYILYRKVATDNSII